VGPSSSDSDPSSAFADDASRDFDIAVRAIGYVVEHRAAQPSLGEVAAHVGLSESHLQRVFSRWAGVSPKRLLQFLTADYAKVLLRDGASSVLDAAYGAGLSGPGRLHDLMVAVDAVTPGEWRRFGEGVEIRYGWTHSPFGDAFVGTTDRGLCALYFATDDDERSPLTRLEHDWPGATMVEDDMRSMGPRIFSGFDGHPDKPLPLLLKGTNLQVKVWEALLRVPEGQAISYATLAEQVGRPDAVRAIASAVARNPVGYLIPCHRILRSNGTLGSFSWGVDRKRAMLGYEVARSVREADDGR
jgi:AraC family transcriptional regulator of adaptative response/methylated-DNA-[protein]-cysteine methyltransferase